MAVNFLRLSKAYRASTPEQTQRLDDEVAKILGTSYKVPKGSQKERFAELLEANPGQTPLKINTRIRVLRTAYAMLSGHPTATHKEDVKKGYASAAGYLALKQDGITSWEQVVQMLAQENEAAKAPVNPLTQMNTTYALVRRDELEALLAEQARARTTLEEAMKRIDALEQKLVELKPVAVEEVSLRAHLPEAPQALALPSSKTSFFVADLPKTSRYRGVGREVRYTKTFIERLKALSEHERKRVLERVTWITDGSSAPGLRVKPLTPPSVAEKYGGKPLCARATGDLRIVFKPNGQLEFVDILRKGDIPGTSEA